MRGGAYVFVCGSIAMGHAARDALIDVLGSSNCVSELQKEGRFVEELFIS